MSEPRETPTDNPSRGGFGVFAWVMMVLVVYVLSTGPIMKLGQLAVIDFEVLDYAYAPVYWLAHNCSPAEEFFTWYVEHVWRVRRYHVR